MTLSETYVASPIKRNRSTKVEIEARRGALYRIVEAGRPMTVRQCYYQATVRGVIDKTEAGYRKVQTDLVLMRKSGTMPYDWLVDNTRWQRKPVTFDSVEQALLETARFYRKALWTHVNDYVEIWLEKDALAGAILPITSKYDVPLMVARGYSSLSFLSTTAEYIRALKKRVFIYHLGDFDPSGVNAGEKIEETLAELAPDADITFARIGVTPSQIEEWNLPTRTTKASDTRSKNFGDISVELDAIHPETLRRLVELHILDHLPPEEFRVLMQAEESEKTMIGGLVSMALRSKGGAA